MKIGWTPSLHQRQWKPSVVNANQSVVGWVTTKTKGSKWKIWFSIHIRFIFGIIRLDWRMRIVILHRRNKWNEKRWKSAWTERRRIFFSGIFHKRVGKYIGTFCNVVWWCKWKAAKHKAFCTWHWWVFVYIFKKNKIFSHINFWMWVLLMEWICIMKCIRLVYALDDIIASSQVFAVTLLAPFTHI